MIEKNGYYMNEKVLKCLYDIKNAIDEIDTFFANREKLFNWWQTLFFLQISDTRYSRDFFYIASKLMSSVLISF